MKRRNPGDGRGIHLEDAVNAWGLVLKRFQEIRAGSVFCGRNFETK
jgi:hypothetical protein